MERIRQAITAFSAMAMVSLPLTSTQADPVFDAYFQVAHKKKR